MIRLLVSLLCFLNILHVTDWVCLVLFLDELRSLWIADECLPRLSSVEAFGGAIGDGGKGGSPAHGNAQLVTVLSTSVIEFIFVCSLE